MFRKTNERKSTPFVKEARRNSIAELLGSLNLEESSDDEWSEFGVFKEELHLDQYYPCDKIKRAQSQNFSVESLVERNLVMQEYSRCRQLQPSNIAKILGMLLEIEDAHTMQPYCSLYQKNVLLTKSRYDRLEFEINTTKNVNIENVLSCNADEVVFVPPHSAEICTTYPIDLLMVHPYEDRFKTSREKLRHVRTLEQLKNRTAYVKMLNDDDDVFSISNSTLNLNTRYNIIFRPNRYNIRVQHHALEILNADRLAYIFPTKDVNNVEPSEDTSLEIINKQICTNPEQLQAVKRIVAGANRYAPYIVVGPPGTGKTTTIVEAILQLYIRLPACRILITAGSNSACDTVALKICAHFEKHSKLIELSRERRQKGLNGEFKKPKDILRVFAKSWSERNDLLMKYANFIGREIVTPSVQALQKYNIIVVTLCTMGRLRSGIIGDWPFTHLFIDEAGAITEPETLVAITSVNTKNCRVIMSGDTKQLGPVILSKVAAEFGLKHSLMERLVKRECYAVKEDGTYDTTLQTRLRRNYRSHPEILRLFNHLYYKDELIADVKKDGLLRWNELDMLKNKGFPIIFEAVRGQLGKSKSSQSSYNQAEVDKVICVTKKLLEHVDFKKIGIISPYKLQCAKIKGELRKCNLEDIEVGTVELFQGREKPIIIVSFVKSNCNLGFVTDPQRLNVILSRAQSLLVMIGNPETLQINDDFKYLIEECKRMQTFRLNI